jgi:nucleoside-diphosphate-sugar epimerase
LILVTGHRGFIGARLFALLPGAVGIDVREGRNLLTCGLPTGAVLVYHLAAQSDVMASWDDPLHDLENVRITARLVHAYPDARIVYANSCAAVGPETPYGFSKKVSADYLKTFHRDYVNCVFPNVFGEGGRSVVDKFAKSDDVHIFGDGEQTRDFVHVDDIAAGLVMAQHWPKGEYFMGSGHSVTVNELARGKRVTYLNARREPRQVLVPNTTPDWAPTRSVV